MKKILKNDAVQSLIASLLCIILGLLIGYIVLLFINPEGAWDAILAVLKNFLKTANHSRRVKLIHLDALLRQHMVVAELDFGGLVRARDVELPNAHNRLPAREGRHVAPVRRIELARKRGCRRRDVRKRHARGVHTAEQSPTIQWTNSQFCPREAAGAEQARGPTASA